MTWKKLLASKLFLFFLLVVLSAFGYSFGKELQQRYVVEKEIANLQNDILKMEKDNQDLANLIAYFRSPGFQEKELRRKLSLQKPGEHVVALPDGQNRNVQASQPAAAEANAQPNWKKWWDYYFKE